MKKLIVGAVFLLSAFAASATCTIPIYYQARIAAAIHNVPNNDELCKRLEKDHLGLYISGRAQVYDGIPMATIDIYIRDPATYIESDGSVGGYSLIKAGGDQSVADALLSEMFSRTVKRMQEDKDLTDILVKQVLERESKLK